jgi:hypothetical protein
MARKRSHRVDTDDLTSSPKWSDSLPPKTTASGKGNPAYYRAMLNRLNEMVVDGLSDGTGLPDGYSQVQKGILEAAKMAGLTERDILDERSEERIAADAVDRLLENGSILERMDAEITAMERLLDRADLVTKEGIQRVRDAGAVVSQEDMDVHLRRNKQGKALRSLLARAKGLRARVIPQKLPKNDPKDWIDYQIVKLTGQILRLMVYISEPDTASTKNNDWNLNWHHGVMAMGLWMVSNRMMLADFGMVPNPKYRSFAGIIPPGHGKTTIGVHFVLSRIAENPRSLGIIVHAQAKMAEQLLGKIASYFAGESTASKRYLALFPHLTLADSDNNKSSLRIKSDFPTKSPNISACGINARYNGADAEWVWFDDPIDQADALNPTTAKNIFDKINGTWLARIRSSPRSIDMTTATLWAVDDPVNKRITPPVFNARETLCVKIACGGPGKQFKPVWPDVYGEAFLRKKYRDLADPQKYAALYECDPRSESGRLIKSVRLYDPLADEHAKFMRSATRHLSLDPAATKGKASDPAGIVYCADGDIVTTDNGETITERRLRVISAKQLASTQSELTEFSSQFCKDHDVDYIHVETRSAFAAVAEMIEKLYGDIVIRHDPKNKAKIERLRAAGPLIEDSNAASGIRAVVEFPGIQDDNGRFVVDPAIEWLVEQFLSFGVIKDNHGLDALVQVALYLAPTLSTGGRGYASSVIRGMSLGENSTGRRFLEHLRAMRQAETTGNDEEKEDSWLKHNWQ